MRTPRIAVALPTDVRQTVNRLALLNRCSAASIIAEAICEAHPVLLRVADAIESVHKVNAEKADLIRATLADAQAEAERTAATALALLERIASGPETDGREARAASKGRAAAATKPSAAGRNLPPSC